MNLYTEADKRKHRDFLRAAKKAGIKVPKVTQWSQGGRRRQVAPGGTRRRAAREEEEGGGDDPGYDGYFPDVYEARSRRIKRRIKLVPAWGHLLRGGHGVQELPAEAAGPRAPRGQAHAEAEEAENVRWGRGRDERSDALLASLQQRAERQQAAFAQLQQSVSRCLDSASCRVCQATGRQTGAYTQVKVLTMGHAWLTEVPVFECGTCCVGTAPNVRPLQFTPTPLQADCWPGTPVQAWDPLTAPDGQVPLWLGLDLLEDLALLREAAYASLSCEGIAAFLLARWERAGCATTVKADLLGRVLGAALRELAYTRDALDVKVEELCSSYTQPLAECAACTELAVSERTLHSAHTDFNFKLFRFRTAHQLHHAPPPNRRAFLDNSVVEQMGSEGLPRNCQPVQLPHCASEFRADQELGRRSARHDITAVGLLTCRHGVILRAMNCFTGERHVYALCFVAWLASLGLSVSFLWYDIACKWARTFLAWRDAQPAEMQEQLQSMRCPLPPFHIKCHSLACQEHFASEAMEGAGITPGEPCEQVNAELKPLAATTKHMTPTRREARLEQAFRRHNLRRDATLLELLLRMEQRVMSTRDAAAHEEAACRAALLTGGLSEEEVECELAALQARSGDSPAIAPPDEGAAYARAKLLVFLCPQPNLPGLPDPGLLGSRGADLQEARELVSRSAHSAEPGSPEFVPYQAQLVTVEARAAARAAEDLACRAQAAELHLPQLAGDSAEQRRLLQRKLAAKGKAEKEVGKLKAWLAPEYAPAELLPEDVQQMRQAAALGPPWDIRDVMQCRFPWHANPAQGPHSSRQLQLHRLRKQLLVAARCKEELALIQKEKAAAVRTWQTRAQQLQLAIDTSRESVAGLEARAAALPSGSQEGAAAEGAPEGPSASAAAGGRQASSPQHAKAVLEGLVQLLEQRLRALESMRAAAAAALARPTVAAALECVRYHAAPAASGEAEDLVHDEDGAALSEGEAGVESGFDSDQA